MTTNFPTVINPQDLSTAIANSQVQETQSTGGFSFLKCDYLSGTWILGRDQEDVTDEEVLINTATIQHGWILWSGGRNTKSMVAFNQPLPMAMESIGADHPSEGRSLQGAMIDNGEPLIFDTNSMGGRKGVDALWKEIMLQNEYGSAFLYPKVKLTSESYVNKKQGGKLCYNPVFKLMWFCDKNGDAEPSGKNKQGVENKIIEPEEVPVDTHEPKRQRRRRKGAD